MGGLGWINVLLFIYPNADFSFAGVFFSLVANKLFYLILQRIPYSKISIIVTFVIIKSSSYMEADFNGSFYHDIR